MRRWNGWGEESTVVESGQRPWVPGGTGRAGRTLAGRQPEAALAKVPASRLEADPRYSIDPRERRACPRAEPAGLAGDARGDFGVYPDAVAIRKPPSRSASCWPWPTPATRN